mmetsp:Transcript_26766/g.37745  ORF Transcript_26766/g.37745 Transcript_26766/m.37745 type:complete len:169 (+) Transcript_26766:36-542(+)
MKYLSMGTRIYLASAIASPAISRTMAFAPTRIHTAHLSRNMRQIHGSNHVLFMSDPSYGVRKTMFGIEDKTFLKDVSTKENVIYVDVRDPDEIEQAQCSKPFVAAKYLLGECDQDMVGKDLPDKDANHVVFCAKGGRASKACQKLKDLGYTNVYNAGGVGDLDLFLEE